MNITLIVENSLNVVKAAAADPNIVSADPTTKTTVMREVKKVEDVLRPESSIKKEIDDIIKLKMGLV